MKWLIYLRFMNVVIGNHTIISMHAWTFSYIQYLLSCIYVLWGKWHFLANRSRLNDLRLLFYFIIYFLYRLTFKFFDHDDVSLDSLFGPTDVCCFVQFTSRQQCWWWIRCSSDCHEDRGVSNGNNDNNPHVTTNFQYFRFHQMQTTPQSEHETIAWHGCEIGCFNSNNHNLDGFIRCLQFYISPSKQR